MTQGVPKVYLDTNIFQPLIYESDSLTDRRFARDMFEHLRGDVRDERTEVVIPKVAIGELVNNFYEDLTELGPAEVGTWDDFATELEWYLDQLEVILCQVNREVVSTAADLIERDGRLGGTDAAIASCALEDRWSTHLVSGDPDFHETDAIQAIDDERQPTPRFASLNITDNY